MKKISANEAWEKLFDKYNIINEINNKGFFNITADQIKEFKEPRLMAKWDSSESLPNILRANKVNILPTARGTYILSDFKLYEEIPDCAESVTKMQKVEIPHFFESIDTENITSESNAINVLMISSILENFLDEEDNFMTFNGRMGTGEFKFSVDRLSRTPLKINVKNAQCEIDAGFENDRSIVIMEAKNVVHPDFHIRQLYYPFRLWENKVKKPIRLVFSIYSNQVFRLLEYRFRELNDYSSIELVQEKNYTLQDTEINNEDLLETYKETVIKTDDNQSKQKNKTPFIQANSFERVISLIENLQEKDMTLEEIAELMQFQLRQSYYYYNAGKYLGLFQKYDSIEYSAVDDTYYKGVKVKLTKQGMDVAKMNYKPRQLQLVRLILEHKIFNELFYKAYTAGEIPEANDIMFLMRKCNVCNEGQIKRRAGTVSAWLKWIFKLTKIEKI